MFVRAKLKNIYSVQFTRGELTYDVFGIKQK